MKTSRRTRRFAIAETPSKNILTRTQHSTPSSIGNGLPCACTPCSHRSEPTGPRCPSSIALTKLCRHKTTSSSQKTGQSYSFNTTRCPREREEHRFPSVLSSTLCCWNPSVSFLDRSLFHVHIRQQEMQSICRTVRKHQSARSTYLTSLLRPWHHQAPRTHGHAQSNVCVPPIQHTSCQNQYHTTP